MTCFWDGILSKISLQEINQYLSPKSHFMFVSQKDFIELLKSASEKITDYLVMLKDQTNCYYISSTMIQENKEWIQNYNTQTIHNGHDCSTCDPFLILITHIFEIQINHNYNGHIIEYKNIKNVRRVVHFSSDQGHFS
jgi:hypothetical protein